MTEQPRPPAAFRLTAPEEDEPPRAKPVRQPRVLPAKYIVFEEGPPPGEAGPLAVKRARPARRGPRLGTMLASALFGLVVLWAGLAATRLIDELFQRSLVIGWIAAGLASLAALAALAIAARELVGLMRLSRIEAVQTESLRSLHANDAVAGASAIARLKQLYASREDLAWGLKSLAQHDGDVMDSGDRLRLAERLLLTPLDQESHRIIARTARRTMLLTTITPAAALDILFVAVMNLRMLRELATLYGGRPSTLSTWRLARMVMGHLAVTGGLALTDSLVQHLVGKGLIGRLSARFGEGAVNGILTARIGLAAREVCRPMPQDPALRETLASLVKEVVNFSGGEEDRTVDSRKP